MNNYLDLGLSSLNARKTSLASASLRVEPNQIDTTTGRWQAKTGKLCCLGDRAGKI